MTKPKPFYFVTPINYSTMIREIVYNRVKDKVYFQASIQDDEDKISVLNEIVQMSMEEAYKIGYTLGVEDGKKFIIP